jgi:hypothetical protein
MVGCASGTTAFASHDMPTELPTILPWWLRLGRTMIKCSRIQMLLKFRLDRPQDNSMLR